MFEKVTGFDWDEGNLLKNWEKHEVSTSECEEVFFNQPLAVKDDDHYSGDEVRCLCLGRTNASRELFVVFTLKGDLTRVISARNMTNAEREAYWKS